MDYDELAAGIARAQAETATRQARRVRLRTQEAVTELADGWLRLADLLEHLERRKAAATQQLKPPSGTV